MQEVLEQIIGYLKGIWLKRRYIMIATWLICPIGWILVSQLEDVYKSQARVYADTQSILRPLLRGLTVETNPDTQLKLMAKTLKSRPNLERIARMTDLDIAASNTEEFEKILDQLNAGIRLNLSGGRDSANIFTISYQAKNPEIAKKVVQSTLTVFIENTLGDNRTDNDSAQEFLNAQLKEYEARLSEAESKTTAFKQKYNDILPGSGGYYSQLKSEKDRLEVAELELKELNTKLASAKKQLADSSQQSGELSDKIEDSNRVATSYDERIKTIENNLDTLLLRFTEKHPDVAEAQRLLKSLQQSRKEELDNYYQSISDSVNGQSGSPISSNPIYQEMQIEVNQLENAAASLNVRVNNYKAKVVDLENRIHTIPEIEQELTNLNRDYEVTQRKYNDLLNRKETATLAKSADDNTNKIEFRVIDPPRAETVPAGPNRLLFFIGITVVGFGAGIALSFLFSQLNPVVTSASQISKATGIPVFGIVSATENLGLKKWHQKKTVIFIASNVLLVAILICFIAFFMFPDAIQAPLKGMF
ncbi:MAG: XrtA system polysaccharide chain length determinant [Thalassotalea sp.]